MQIPEDTSGEISANCEAVHANLLFTTFFNLKIHFKNHCCTLFLVEKSILVLMAIKQTLLSENKNERFQVIE